MNQDPSYRPQPKVAAAGIGGAVAIVIIWAASLFGLGVPAEVAAALTALASFAAGYLKAP